MEIDYPQEKKTFLDRTVLIKELLEARELSIIVKCKFSILLITFCHWCYSILYIGVKEEKGGRRETRWLSDSENSPIT